MPRNRTADGGLEHGALHSVVRCE